MNTIERSQYSEKILWLVEYSDSSLDKDLKTKRQVYAEVNIAEYCAINLKTRMHTVFRAPQAGDYTSHIDLAAGQLAPLVFPELAIAVSEIIHNFFTQYLL